MFKRNISQWLFYDNHKIFKQNQETAAGAHSSFVQNRILFLNNSFFNFSWGTSAEAYMRYFLFDRCTKNLCVRPSTNAFDITSPFLESVGIPTFYDFLRSLDGRSGNKETNRFKLTLLFMTRVDAKKEQVQTK